MIFNIKRKFLKDQHVLELLRGSFVSFIFKIVGISFGYIFTLLVARWYGAESLGLYALSLTILNIFVTLGVFGFDNALVKFVAEYNSQEKPYLVKEIYVKVMYIVIPLGTLLSIILYLTATFFAQEVFKKDQLTLFLQITAFGLLPFILLRVNAALFRGLKNIKLFAFFENLGVMFFSFAGLVILELLFCNLNSSAVITIQIVSIVILMMLSFGIVKKYTNILVTTSKHILQFRKILKVSLPMLLTSSMTLVMGWTDIVMLGMFRSEAEVGIYSVVVKLAGLTSITLIAINSIAAPKFSEFYSKGDMEGLKKTAQDSTKMIFFTSMPIILTLIFLPKQILGMFGNEFLGGYVALWILMTGQIVNSMVGSVGYILIMTGNERVYQNMIIFSSIINIILNYLLVKDYAIEGVAFSTAFSMGLLNIMSFIYIYKRYNFSTIKFIK